MFARRCSFVLALLAGCAAPPANPTTEPVDATEPAPAIAPKPPTPADQVLLRRLTDAFAELTTSGETTEIEALKAQLDRSSTDAFAPIPPSDVSLTGADLRDRIHDAVAIVGRRYLCGKCDDWHVSTASGFFVSSDGALVTSRHVVDGIEGTTFAVMTTDGEVHPVVEVLAAHPDSDVVVLRVEGAGFEALPLRPGIRPGDAVHVLSHPDGAFWYFSSGVVARRSKSRERRRDPVDLLEITADFARGSSGGPVVDSTGAVVGIVQATDSIYYVENRDERDNLQMVFKYCVPAEAVLELVR